jgi:hypothetical protein
MKNRSLLVLPFLLAACGPAPAPGIASATASAAALSPYAFDINLTLTARAAERLASTDERVMVDAMYYGLPVSDDAPGIDKEDMEIGLGASEIEVAPESAAVKVTGEGFDATYLKSVKGDPEVLVNIYSARKTHENNLLNCGIYQGPVSMAQKKPVEIQCDLIDGLNEDGDVIVETGTPGQ